MSERHIELISFGDDVQCEILNLFHSEGFGYCLTFLPTVTILSQYFTRRRSLVIAVASTGESLSMCALAPGERRSLHRRSMHTVTYIKHAFVRGL